MKSLLLGIMIFGATILGAAEQYSILQPASQLPNGIQTQARSYRILRPAPGTYHAGTVIVKMKAPYQIEKGARLLAGTSVNSILADARSREVRLDLVPTSQLQKPSALTSAVGLDRIYTIRYEEPIEPFDLCKQLMQHPDVEYAVPAYKHQLTYNPNDPRFTNQTGLQRLQVPAAWDIVKGTKDIIVAITDSGTDWTHEDLSTQIWKNEDEIAGNGIDDDKNGYIDDIRGWDFVGNVTVNEAASGIYKPDNDPKVDWPSMNGSLAHGTATAGCAGARADNSKGIAGAGFDVTIMPLKCGSDNPQVQAILNGYQAILYAADNGAHIINCSWGGPGSDPSAQDVISYATAKGSLVVASSGNSGSDNDNFPFYPASADGALNVGSTTNSDAPSNFSVYGWTVDVYAPGESVLSTYPGNQYQGQTGTSFSGPLTAGIAALLRKQHPDWTPWQIATQLRMTCDPTTSSNRKKYYGRVNAQRAVATNQTFSAGTRMPGVRLVRGTTPGGLIVTTDPVDVDLLFRNELAPTVNVTITLESLRNDVEFIEGDTMTIASLGTLDSATKTVKLRLRDGYAWYENSIQLGATIRAGAVVNYCLIEVPVRLPTKNAQNYLLYDQYLTFTNVSRASDGTAWATGMYLNQPIVAIGSGSSGNIGGAPYQTSVVEAMSSTSLLIAGTYQGKQTVSRSTNSANAWTHADVSTLTPKVVALHMSDNSNGLLLGDPLATNDWGLARTTDGGRTWTKFGGATRADAGETIKPGTEFFRQGMGFFITSKNIIMRTMNGGQTWAPLAFGLANAQLYSVAFRDSVNGLALYRPPSSPVGTFRIAATTNAGLNWTHNVFDPKTLNITPLKLMSAGGHVVMVSNQGEFYGSDDNGRTWITILSRPVETVVAADLGITNGARSAYTVGTMMSKLDYLFSGPNSPKTLEARNDTLNFGSLRPSQARTRTAIFASTNEGAVTIEEFYLTPAAGTPDTAFSIINPPDSLVYGGTNTQIGVRFVMADTGTFRGTLTVKSNGSPEPLVVELVARVDPPVSVEEDRLAGVRVYPNPVTDQLTIDCGRLVARGSWSLVTVDGVTVLGGQLETQTALTVNASAVANGAYLVVVEADGHRVIVPVTIMR